MIRFVIFASKLLTCLVVITVALVLPWRWLAPPTSAFMLQYRISAINTEKPFHHRWTPWEQISPQTPIAVVASEDQKFPTHHGFDLESIQGALDENRKRMRGASTVSQQVAKNLYLWSGQSWLRKGLEAYLTVFVELLWPKRRILEIYLNIAEFGPGVYGVGAASTLYFKKPAGRLSLTESARLAAVLPNPNRFSAARPSPYVLERVAWITLQVNQLGGPGYLKDL